ncbi:(2Fe-2S)-binding protein [Coprothermobacteraceae bacterium]|nr:(2Fe-2S)-binding protein [Coprothermobacteraceae bacterium]
MDPKKVIICRCEDVTLEEVREAIKNGYTSWDEIKRLLRVGMGPCGGKTCKMLVLRELAAFHKKPIEKLPIRPTAVRPPLRSTPFRAFLKEEEL